MMRLLCLRRVWWIYEAAGRQVAWVPATGRGSVAPRRGALVPGRGGAAPVAGGAVPVAGVRRLVAGG
jgi:hypothetical protein